MKDRTQGQLHRGRRIDSPSWEVWVKRRLKVLRWSFVGASAGLVLYLSIVALGWVAPWGWFGAKGSVWTILITVTVIGGACALSLRTRTNRPGSIPVGVIAGLSLTSAVLAFSSFVFCGNDERPKGFTALMWATTVVKGGIDDHSIGDKTCPDSLPIALEIARLAGLSAVFIGVLSVGVALLQTQWDRTRIRFAGSVTAVVDLDDEARPMIAAIARTLDARSQLAVLVPGARLQAYGDLRTHGARVLEADFADPGAWLAPRWWRRLDKLYLLSADASANLQRLALINERRPVVDDRQRLPLIVRVDDPWQAQSWRAQQMGKSDTRWLSDAASKYELTAVRLLDRPLIFASSIRTIIICGTSPLTLALCADIARRGFERSYLSADDDVPVASVTIVAANAEEYRQDFLDHQKRVRLPTPNWVHAVSQAPSMATVAPLIEEAASAAPGSTAVIMVDPGGQSTVDPTLGTRLAARFASLPIFAWDANALELQNVPSIIGQLQQFRLAMDVVDGAPQDVWERAARLIHARYSESVVTKSDATKPWAELDEFYRASNRRQVRNAMWMVERIAHHTWDAFDGYLDAPPRSDDRTPLQELQAIGFDHEAAMAMAGAEHADWCRYLESHDWHYGKERDVKAKTHEKLLPWDKVVEAKPEALNAALNSLLATLSALRELGYRSQPQWRTFRRDGTVTAKQRDAAWTWTTSGGEVMQAAAGDWEVHDDRNESWSVKDAIFRATYEHIGNDEWRRCGLVEARPARAGEPVDTLEGPVIAAAGSWVIRGAAGEQWTNSADKFAKNYSGPVEPTNITAPVDT